MTTEELFKRHAVFVAKFLRRLGVKDDAIDDAVQDVFLVVHKSGGYAPGAAKPTTYLATVAIHAAAAYRRRERLATVRAGSSDVDELASNKVDSAQNVETRQRLRTLHEALSRLDLSLQQTLILADGEGETCVSIAAAMDVPLGTVYWRLSHAREKFRHALGLVQAAELQGRPSQASASPRARAWSLAAIFGIEWGSAPDMALLRSLESSLVHDPSGELDITAALERLRARLSENVPAPSWLPAAKTPAPWSSTLSSPVALGAGMIAIALASIAILPKRSRSEVDRHDDGTTRASESASVKADTTLLAVHASEASEPSAARAADLHASATAAVSAEEGAAPSVERALPPDLARTARNARELSRTSRADAAERIRADRAGDARAKAATFLGAGHAKRPTRARLASRLQRRKSSSPPRQPGSRPSCPKQRRLLPPTSPRMRMRWQKRARSAARNGCSRPLRTKR